MMESKHIKYPKIKPLFRYDENWNYVMGELHPDLSTMFDVDSDTIYVQEKVDGANFQFQRIGDELVCGSRNMLLTPPARKFVAVDVVSNKFVSDPDQFIEGYVYYAESMQRHTINYGDIPPCIGYDVLDISSGLFVFPEYAQHFFARLDIPFLKPTKTMDAKTARTTDFPSLITKSAIGNTGVTMEGIVIKNHERFSPHGQHLFGKLVTNAFKEANASVLGAPKRRKRYNTEKEIVNTFVTNTRIDKKIFDIREQNNKISMKDMRTLYKLVGDDVLTEEIINIVKTSRWKTLNFGKFYSILAKKCAKRFQEVINDE